MNNVEKTAQTFEICGKVTEIRENNRGHINSTYLVCCGDKKYVMQKINKNVFKKPEQVMSNIIYVTQHIASKLCEAGKNTESCALHFVKTNEGKYFSVDGSGDYWRMYHFIEGECYESCETAELFCQVGEAFGEFQKQLSDFDASLLYETIPNFHNTASRYLDFERAVEQNLSGRAHLAQAEIEFVRRRKAVCDIIVKGIEDGKFPLRVTHNDTKLNNIILGDDGYCVIDLDTVMPGSMLYDFGDAIRFGASSAAEDETDLKKVFIKTELFESFTKGYLCGLGSSATKDEILALPEGARVITFETGMRFLTDYLNGDTYFRTAYPEHNIVRARNQFKLVADMENKMSELKKIVEKYI